MAKKLSKNKVGYESPAKGPDHCRDCMYFLADEHACQKIKGIINSEDWCRKFMKTQRTTKIVEGDKLIMPNKVPSERNLNQPSDSGMREHSVAAMQASSTLGNSFNFHTRPVPDNE